MNIVLPPKFEPTKKQLFIYITIIIVCIISIILSFYVQFYARKSVIEFLGIKIDAELGKKSNKEIENIKAHFDQMFTNSIEDDNKEGNKSKEDVNKDLVYTGYQKKESKGTNYDIDINIPYINIDNEIIDEYNDEIKETFEEKAKEILRKQSANVIYTVEYVANVHEGILSLIIKTNLKEGSNPQRVIIQAYNYDLRNKKEISLEEVLDIERLDETEVQQKIKSEIEEEQKRVEDLSELGYNVYSRDVDSKIYNIENSKEFYLTDNTLFVVYAYGNETYTSEMDLIVI